MHFSLTCGLKPSCHRVFRNPVVRANCPPAVAAQADLRVTGHTRPGHGSDPRNHSQDIVGYGRLLRPIVVRLKWQTSSRALYRADPQRTSALVPRRLPAWSIRGEVLGGRSRRQAVYAGRSVCGRAPDGWTPNPPHSPRCLMRARARAHGTARLWWPGWWRRSREPLSSDWITLGRPSSRNARLFHRAHDRTSIASDLSLLRRRHQTCPRQASRFY
jgi:hypothetical protein